MEPDKTGILLAGAMHKKHFFTETRYDLTDLGIDGIRREELLLCLYEGIYGR